MRYCVKLLLVGLATLLVSLGTLALAPVDRQGKLAYSIARWWTWAILKIAGIRLKVRGLDRLEPGRPYVFIVNHQSNIDIPVLVQGLTGFQLRWVAKKELLYIPFFGWGLWASKHITVDRSNRRKSMASLRKAREGIVAGICVVVFPEGTRSPDGRLLPFKRGGFLLAMKAKAPLVPVTIKGSGSLLPRGDWRIRAGEVEVIVSDPIGLEQVQGKNLNDLLNQVRAIIESHSRQYAASARADKSFSESPRAATATEQGYR